MSSAIEEKTIKTIKYIFEINDECIKQVDLTLSFPDLSLIKDVGDSHPNWAKLSCHKCPCCNLDESSNKFCPVALNMVSVINEFNTYLSYKEVTLKIITDEREFKKAVLMQEGLSSLFGIIMTTSGCPILDKLRPMVFTHLPFATGEETAYRVMSMYVLAQYFVKKYGNEPDWELKGLIQLYKDIALLNEHFIKRFSDDEGASDAHLNAIVKLSCFSIYTISMIEENWVVDLEKIFHTYLK